MKRKLNMAIFTYGFYMGGTERQIVELLKGLDQDLFNISVGAMRPGGELEHELTGVGIKVEYFPVNSLKNPGALLQLWQLRKFLIKNKIDLLHTYSIFGNTFGTIAGALARIPVIIASRRDLYNRDILFPYSQLQVTFARHVDAVIANAQIIKQVMVEQEHVAADKIFVVNNGIDLHKFADHSCRDIVRKELGLQDHNPVIGVLAELKPIKGHKYLFEAVSQLVADYPELRVLLIGETRDTDYRNYLENLVTKLNIREHVIFGGRNINAARQLAAVDISALPSLTEGLSNAVLESMAARLPVIATNVGGNPELIENGENGLLVPAKDAYLMAEALRILLRDRNYATTLARRAQETVANRFTIQKMVDATSRLYLQLAEARSHQAGLASRLGLRRQLAEI